MFPCDFFTHFVFGAKIQICLSGFFVIFWPGIRTVLVNKGKCRVVLKLIVLEAKRHSVFYGLVLYSQLLSSSFFLCPYHFRRIRDMNNAIKDDNEIRFSLVKKRFSWLITWSHPWRYVIIFQNSTMSKTGFHTVWKSLKMSRDKSNFGHFSRENLTLSRCFKITQNVALIFFYFGIFHQFLYYQKWPV